MTKEDITNSDKYTIQQAWFFLGGYTKGLPLKVVSNQSVKPLEAHLIYYYEMEFDQVGFVYTPPAVKKKGNKEICHTDLI